MTESWKEPEEDNMSIGELAEWLMGIPLERQHLQVKLVWEGQIFTMNTASLAFTDGKRYYAEGLLKGRSTFDGIYLEIDADNKYD